MKKRSILMGVFTIAIAAVIGVGSTLAWFTDSTTASASVTMGTIKIQLNNVALVSKSGSTNKAIPGDQFTNNPTVTNTGKNDCYIRLKGTLTDADGKEVKIGSKTVKFEDLFFPNVIKFVGFKPVALWVPGTDGYIYYTPKVAAGGTTDALALAPNGCTFKIPEALQNEYQGKGLKVTITAEAVQSDNLPILTNWKNVSDITTGAAARTAVAGDTEKVEVITGWPSDVTPVTAG